ncbi:hypothetical protein BH11PSE2_BH11PSE2_12880 [soil metagenome]
MGLASEGDLRSSVRRAAKEPRMRPWIAALSLAFALAASTAANAADSPCPTEAVNGSFQALSALIKASNPEALAVLDRALTACPDTPTVVSNHATGLVYEAKRTADRPTSRALFARARADFEKLFLRGGKPNYDYNLALAAKLEEDLEQANITATVAAYQNSEIKLAAQLAMERVFADVARQSNLANQYRPFADLSGKLHEVIFKTGGPSFVPALTVFFQGECAAGKKADLPDFLYKFDAPTGATCDTR